MPRYLIEYKNNKRDKVTEYYNDGKVKMTIEYTYGNNLMVLLKRFCVEGWITSISTSINGNLEEEYNSYDSIGNVTLKKLYRNNRLVKLKDEDNRRYSFNDAWGQICDKKFGKLKEIFKKLIKETRYTLNILPSVDEKYKWSYAKKPWDSDKVRIKTTFGRIVRRQLKVSKEKISDADLAEFTDLLNNHTWLVCRIERLSGSHIEDAYAESEASSCMTDSASQYTAWYGENPDKVSLLIATKSFSEDESFSNKARALLWIDDEGKLVLDRAYGEKGGVYAITEYARKLGAKMRDNPYANSGIKEYEGTVTMDLSNKFYPYMDTFKYGEVLNNKMIISTSCRNKAIVFESQDGFIKYTCKECGSSLEVLEYSTGECEDCENTFICYNCDDRTNDYDFGNLVDGEPICRYCIDTAYTHCDDCEKYYHFGKDCIYISDGENLCEDCIKERERLLAERTENKR